MATQQFDLAHRPNSRFVKDGTTQLDTGESINEENIIDILREWAVPADHAIGAHPWFDHANAFARVI